MCNIYNPSRVIDEFQSVYFQRLTMHGSVYFLMAVFMVTINNFDDKFHKIFFVISN